MQHVDWGVPRKVPDLVQTASLENREICKIPPDWQVLPCDLILKVSWHPLMLSLVGSNLSRSSNHRTQRKKYGTCLLQFTALYLLVLQVCAEGCPCLSRQDRVEKGTEATILYSWGWPADYLHFTVILYICWEGGKKKATGEKKICGIDTRKDLSGEGLKSEDKEVF